MAATFEEFMAQERERLSKEREEVFNQQQELEDKLQGIVRELSAIDAYENVKKGKAASPAATTQPAKRKGPAPGTQRAPRGSGAGAKQQVLELVRANAQKGILAKNVSDQLPDVKNVANVLSALAKEGLIQQSARRQPYFPTYPNKSDEAA
jgi:hypothetical protein